MIEDEEGREENEQRAEVGRLLNVAKFKFVVEDWVRTPVVRYLIERSEHEVRAALEELKHVDAEDAKAVRELQHRIGVCECWQQWIEDAITEGENAHEQLIDMGQ